MHSIKTCVKTEAFASAYSYLLDNNFVIITGMPGDGKTTLGYMCLKALVENGMEPLIVQDISDIPGFVVNKHLAVLIDDLLDINTLPLSSLQKIVLKIDKTISYEQLYCSSVNKIIVIVQKDSLGYLRTYFKNEWLAENYTVDISSTFLCKEERLNILKLYASHCMKKNEMEKICSSEDLKFGFPRCCRLFGEKREGTLWDQTSVVLKDHFKKMKGIYFFVLAAIAIRNGEIHYDDMVSSYISKKFYHDVAVLCGMPLDASIPSSVMRTIDAYLNVYIKYDIERDVYCFINHDVFKGVLRQLFESNPFYFIKTCDFRCLHYLTIHQEKYDSLFLNKRDYKFFVERLKSEIQINTFFKFVEIFTKIDVWDDDDFLNCHGGDILSVIQNMDTSKKIKLVQSVCKHNNGSLLRFLMDKNAKIMSDVCKQEEDTFLQGIDLAVKLSTNCTLEKSICLFEALELSDERSLGITARYAYHFVQCLEQNVNHDDSKSITSSRYLHKTLSETLETCARKILINIPPNEDLILKSSVRLCPAMFIRPIFRNKSRIPRYLLQHVVLFVINSRDSFLARLLSTEIINRFRQEHEGLQKFFDVWTGYSQKDNMSTFDTLVAIISDKTCKSRFPNKYLGLEMVCRYVDEVSDESRTLIQHENFPESTFGINLSSSIFEEMFQKHSNITYISASCVHSQRYQTANSTFQFKPCIVVYVHIKGIVPFGEKYFPTYLENNLVDVREGLCWFASLTALPGKKIKDYEMKSGTLGGFISLNNETYCISCAHVLCQNSVLHGESRSVYERMEGREVKLHDTNDEGYEQEHLLGTVENIVFKHGDKEKTSIDAVLIKVNDKIECNGDFNHYLPGAILKETGVQSNPVFWNGETEYVSIKNCNKRLLKCGAKTGMTTGQFNYDHATCRIRSKEVEHTDRGNKFKVRMYNCMEIHPLDKKDKKFFEEGDSGSLVFMIEEDDPPLLKCIGLGFGCSSTGSCFMTPIQDVLKELRLPPTCLMKFKNPFSKQDVDNKDIVKAIKELGQRLESKIDSLSNKVDAIVSVNELKRPPFDQ